DLRIAVERRIQQHPFVGFVGEFRLLHRLVEVAERKQGERMRRREIERKLQVDEAEILASLPPKRGAEPIKHLGSTCPGRVYHQGKLFSGLKFVGRLDDERMARHRFVERGEDLHGVSSVPPSREETPIALHHAKRRRIALVAALEALRGLSLLAG